MRNKIRIYECYICKKPLDATTARFLVWKNNNFDRRILISRNAYGKRLAKHNKETKRNDPLIYTRTSIFCSNGCHLSRLVAERLLNDDLNWIPVIKGSDYVVYKTTGN